MLELPITVRVPLPEEMPHRDDIEALLYKRSKAKIIQGYTINDNANPKMPYSFQAEININNSSLWELMLALAGFLPEQICCTYCISDEDSITTAYFPKTFVLQQLNVFKSELSQDCALEFSLFAHAPEGLTEIIVTSYKYLRYAGKNKNDFLKCMKTFQLNEIPGLAFVDEYPKITEPLKKFFPTSRRPEDVIWSLNKNFRIENV
ncbi:MAG: hypothetical protein QM802_08030 [Agriterribacter sp.]